MEKNDQKPRLAKPRFYARDGGRRLCFLLGLLSGILALFCLFLLKNALARF